MTTTGGQRPDRLRKFHALDFHGCKPLTLGRRILRERAMVSVRTRAFAPLGCFVVAVGLFVAAGSVASAKTFRVNVVADPAQMDPITHSEIVAGRIIRNMYEGFTTISDDG